VAVGVPPRRRVGTLRRPAPTGCERCPPSARQAWGPCRRDGAFPERSRRSLGSRPPPRNAACRSASRRRRRGSPAPRRRSGSRDRSRPAPRCGHPSRLPPDRRRGGRRCRSAPRSRDAAGRRRCGRRFAASFDGPASRRGRDSPRLHHACRRAPLRSPIGFPLSPLDPGFPGRLHESDGKPFNSEGSGVDDTFRGPTRANGSVRGPTSALDRGVAWPRSSCCQTTV